MAANRYTLLRALVLATVRKGETSGQTPVTLLESIITGKFDLEFTDGKTVISTNEAGGGVSFAVLPGLAPDDVMALAIEAIDAIKGGFFGTDEEHPDPYANPRRIKRLRASFRKATI